MFILENMDGDSCLRVAASSNKGMKMDGLYSAVQKDFG